MWSLACCLVLVLTAQVQSTPTNSPTNSPTPAPTTKAPTTKAPTTKAPTTEVPTTTAPTTGAPTTGTPTTTAPTTTAPTKPPAPTTGSPTTGTPTTGAPTTGAPATGVPTTRVPSTGTPTRQPTPPTPAPTCVQAIKNITSKTPYINRAVSNSMLDVSGLAPNTLGDYEACMNICEPAGHHCTGNPAVHCTLKDKSGIVTQGVCVPSLCSEDDVNRIISTGTLFNLTLPGFTAHCGSYKEQSWNAGSIIMMIVVAGLILLVVAGTALDIQPRPKADNKRELENKATGTPPTRDSPTEPLLPVEKERPSHGMQALLAFSLPRSFQSLFERSPNRKYKALDGIRAISLGWIILGHTLNFMLFVGISNPTEFYPTTGWTAGLPFVIFIYGCNNAVDTFFFLSAFLATLVIIRRLEKGEAVPMVGSIVHRFLRLTPAYLFVMMMYMSFGAYMGDGPFWYQMKANNIEACKRYWWTNLIYINNFWPWVYADQCLPWTWYLANDMQFFVIGVIITVVFHKQLQVAFALMGLMFAGSMVCNAWIVSANQIQALSLQDPAVYQNDVYDKPYTRISPYLIGMFVAFIYTKTKFRIVHRRDVWISVVLVFVFTFVPCYTFWGEITPVLSGWNTTQNVLYLTLARPCWTLGVAILTYLCICDVGGFFDWFLSLPVWDPMAKLSYSAYLVHPMIMRIFYFNKRQLFFWSSMEYAIHYVAMLIFAYSVAMVVYCVVETPFAALEKVVGGMLGGKKKPRAGATEAA